MPLSNLSVDQLDAALAYLEQKRAGPWERAARISIIVNGVLAILLVIFIVTSERRISDLERHEGTVKKVLKQQQEALEELAK